MTYRTEVELSYVDAAYTITSTKVATLTLPRILKRHYAVVAIDISLHSPTPLTGEYTPKIYVDSIGGTFLTAVGKCDSSGDLHHEFASYPLSIPFGHGVCLHCSNSATGTIELALTYFQDIR